LSPNVPTSGEAWTGDLAGVPLLLRLVGEEEVAQDWEKTSNVGAVATEGEGCTLSCSLEEDENGSGLVLEKKEDRRGSLLVGVLGAAGLLS
jgi:hypothetical protein